MKNKRASTGLLPTSAKALTAEIMRDPQRSQWLKISVRTLNRRDPITAYNDAVALAVVQVRRWMESKGTPAPEQKGGCR